MFVYLKRVLCSILLKPNLGRNYAFVLISCFQVSKRVFCKKTNY